MEELHIALVGHPNVGKTTLINALTHGQQKVGNWAGVTVERITGTFEYKQNQITVTDLPGIYSLASPTDSMALDEHIAHQFMMNETPDVIINVVDASSLERNLYLTMQLLDKGIPILLVLNKTDLANRQQININEQILSQKLGCPVIALASHKTGDMTKLKEAILSCANHAAVLHSPIRLPEIMELTVSKLMQQGLVREEALALLDGTKIPDETLTASVATLKNQIMKALDEPDMVIASLRYEAAHDVSESCVQKQGKNHHKVTAFLDTIFLNRLLGIPLFLFVMYLLFFFSIHVSGVFQDFFEMMGQAIFVDGLATLLHGLHSPAWLIALLAGGVGKGINTTLSFVPVLAIMFLLLSILEMSGYMARAAFVMDRLMRVIGLSGKSFIPLIIGFGCNVPAIMATRTLPSEKDRILTIMMSPFMSCSARLAIYSVFVTAFFPVGGQNIIFALYLIGIITAIFTGWILKKCLGKHEVDQKITELPTYHMLNAMALMLQTWHRLKSFLMRAGVVIIPVSVVIGVLNALTWTGTIDVNDPSQHSLLSSIGQFLTPLFHPIGITIDNWQATVGLLTGVLAKEVVVGTLNTLYMQTSHLLNHAAEQVSFIQQIQQAFYSIPENILALKSALLHPLSAGVGDDEMRQGVYGVMYQKFDGQIGAFAYLLFVLLYIPCVSTFAVIIKELNRKWALTSIAWSTGLAYGIAALFFQIATFDRHPDSSLIWIISISLCFAATFLFVRQKGVRHDFI